MDAGPVGRARHRPAERVNFAGQVPLADTADGRVATHLPDRREIIGQQHGVDAKPRGSQRRLGTRVSSADDNAAGAMCLPI